MKLKHILATLAFGAMALAAQAGELTLYGKPNFQGREVTLREPTASLGDIGFNDRASSMVIRSGRWEICVDNDFQGECAVFERGEYRQLQRFNNRISSAREVGTGRDKSMWRHKGPRGMIELFEGPNMGGNSTRLVREHPDLVQVGFNNRTRSIVIEDGAWQLCSEANFRGQCQVFPAGAYPDIGPLSGHVSSVRLMQPDEVRNPAPQIDYSNAVMLFQEEGLRGRSIGIKGDAADFSAIGFNDMAMSIMIQSGTWEFCSDNYFRGQCRILGPGEYRSLEGPLQRAISSVRKVSGQGEKKGDIDLFSGMDFGGARIPVSRDMRNLGEVDFNDRANSLIVHAGKWEFCTHVNFGGPCVVYGPGRYGRLGEMSNGISSLRRVR